MPTVNCCSMWSFRDFGWQWLCSFQNVAFKVSLILGTPASRKWGDCGRTHGRFRGWAWEWHSSLPLTFFLPESSCLPSQALLSLMGKSSMRTKGSGGIGLRQSFFQPPIIYNNYKFQIAPTLRTAQRRRTLRWKLKASCCMRQNRIWNF